MRCLGKSTMVWSLMICLSTSLMLLSGSRPTFGQSELAQNAAPAICICDLHNGTYSAWFRTRPSNWGTANSLRIFATSCVDTGLCGSISSTQSYVTGSYTIKPSSFQTIGNLQAVMGTLSP